MNPTNDSQTRRAAHLRPLSARLPVWDLLGEELTGKVVDFMISVEVWKTDKAGEVRPG